MFTTLKTPAPPTTGNDNEEGERPSASFELDYFEREALPPKLMELTRTVDRSLCENVHVSEFRDGWFLLWDERHPEMLSQDEYFMLKKAEECESDPLAYLGATQEERREYFRIYEDFPSKGFELPLTPKQAFALVAACYVRVDRPSPFAAEIEALLGDAR